MASQLYNGCCESLVVTKSPSCKTGIEQVVGNPFLHAACLTATTCFAAGEEGSIVTHTWSVTLGKHKKKAK